MQEYQLAPLRKENGEKQDAWAIKDDKGTTLLKLIFSLASAP